MPQIDFAPAPTLRTDRLTMRAWRASDIEPFIAMGRDAAVMRYFDGPISDSQSLALAADLQDRFRRWGFGYWALQSAEEDFLGFVGLSRPRFEAHFTPCVEVGWRLARAAWGKGYASEAARAALRFGFYRDEIDEIVAMVSVQNTPSRRVAERLGMVCDPKDNFDYPGNDGSPYNQCVLYRLNSENFHHYKK